MRQRVCTVIKLHTSHEVTVTLMIGEQTTPGVNTVLPPPHPRAFNRSVQSKGAIQSVQLDAPSFPATLDTFVQQALNASLLGK